MATTALGTVLHNLRRSLLCRDGAGATDSELLDDFIERRDDAAFEALVRRHGRMVLGVARRVLRNDADAEDAFQATFLVLVRKAASIRPRNMVGNWLYGVAHTTALKARAMRKKQSAKEHEAATRSRPECAEAWGHLQALLDQELKRLPDVYRAAIVLCDLEGKSIKEAARQLGCPQGTIGTRLARGRRLLSRRLTCHGLTLSGGLIAALVAQNATAASVPPLLLKSTYHAATVIAAGHAAVGGIISAKVAALTEGVLQSMFITKLKVATASFLVAGLLSYSILTATVCATSHTAFAQPAPGQKKEKLPEKEPPAKAPDVLKPRATLDGHGSGVFALAFSPNGKLLASGSDDFSIKIWDAATGKEIKALPGHHDVVVSLVFSADGKSLASTSRCLSGDKKESAAVKLWDVASWEEKVPLKDNDGRFGRAAFSPDGKVVAAFENHAVKLWDTATGKQLATLKEDSANIRALAFSPDSKTLIVGVHSRPGDDPIRLWSWADEKPNGSLSLDGECMDLRFTRDGKTLVTLNGHGEITFWDFENSRPQRTIKTGRSPGWYGATSKFTLSADEKLVAVSYTVRPKDEEYASKVEVRDTTSGELVQTLELETVVTRVAFSAQGQMMATGGFKNARKERTASAIWLQGDGGIVRIWDLRGPVIQPKK